MTLTAGGGMTKAGTDGHWGDAGAFTTQGIVSGGSISFTFPTNNGSLVAGLSATNSGNSYTDIQFGFIMISNACEVSEGGSSVYNCGTFTATDVFSVVLTAGVVTYLKNGSLLYTSGGTPASTLYGKAAAYSNGDSITTSSMSIPGANGVSGIVPKPVIGNQKYFLQGNGSWGPNAVVVETHGASPTCNFAAGGQIVATYAYIVCICNTSRWVNVSDGSTSCSF
jgi:hypothetical protein